MNEKTIKLKKGYAITNIVVGVVFFMSGIISLFDPAVGAYGLITISIGLFFWIVGAYGLSVQKKNPENESLLKKAKLLNMICFVISCLLLTICIALPIIMF